MSSFSKLQASDWHNRSHIACVLIMLAFFTSSCFNYSFTGVSIPSDVRTIYIPFFPDNASSGLSFLSDDLNEALVNRFVNQSRLSLSSSPEDADITLEGTIISYRNRPFSVTGEQQTGLNQVDITVRATFKYRTEPEPEWNRTFNGVFEFDPNEDPIEGEREAAFQAMERIARNMFNDALSSW
ncbi:MAG: LPS assembly lipoprotein LptE [Balneolales bacterium]|nr:LPS assembly lipoprotein LptE [Balneolales bacterium]